METSSKRLERPMSWNPSTVDPSCTSLKGERSLFEDENVHILDQEDRWFERGMQEVIYVHCEQPLVNRSGGLQHQLSATYNAVLISPPWRFNPPSHLASGDLNRVGWGLSVLTLNRHWWYWPVHFFTPWLMWEFNYFQRREIPLGARG